MLQAFVHAGHAVMQALTFTFSGGTCWGALGQCWQAQYRERKRYNQKSDCILLPSSH
jgi:hypothetical protein